MNSYCMFIQGLLILSFTLNLTACGIRLPFLSSQSVSLTSRCQAQADQMGSFMPVVAGHFPIQIKIDEKLNSTQQAAALRAAEIWNQYSQLKFGTSFFTINSLNKVQGSVPQSNSDCEFDGIDQAGGVLIYQESSVRSWNSKGLGSNNPAATVRCSSGDSVNKQVIFFNSNYVMQEQLVSVFLHEYGHTLGLNHSCLNNGSSDDYIACASLNSHSPYRQAVMYPTLLIPSSAHSSFQLKEVLQENDQIRTECLYE